MFEGLKKVWQEKQAIYRLRPLKENYLDGYSMAGGDFTTNLSGGVPYIQAEVETSDRRPVSKFPPCDKGNSVSLSGSSRREGAVRPLRGPGEGSGR